MSKNWLENKYVILTGASSGIGRELCKLLVLKYKARVIGVGRREERMASLKNELGERFDYRLFDVGVREAWQEFATWLVEQNIEPSVLINNAGIFPGFYLTSAISAETFERVFRTNLYSITYAVETIAPLLIGEKKYKPAIINISSSAALCSVVGTTAYTASKCAVRGYTEALALEERGKKHIAIIYPGTTSTELFDGDENTKNSALDLIAMPAKKMAKKIACKIVRRKKRAVLGWDAKLMNWTAKLMPVKGPALIAWVMKVSKSKVFTRVFYK